MRTAAHAWAAAGASACARGRYRRAKTELARAAGAGAQLATQREQVVVEVDLHRVALGGHVAAAHPLVLSAHVGLHLLPRRQPVLAAKIRRDPATLRLRERHE